MTFFTCLNNVLKSEDYIVDIFPMLNKIWKVSLPKILSSGFEISNFFK